MSITGNLIAVGNLSGVVSPGQVGGGAKLQSKSVSPARTAQTVLPDEGFDGLSDVEIGAASINPITISAGNAGNEGIMPGPDYVGFGPINVKPLQNKTVTPTAQQQTITADNYNDYLGLGVVTVEAAPDTLSAAMVDSGNFAPDKVVTVNGQAGDTFWGNASFGELTVNGCTIVGSGSVTGNQINKVSFPDATIIKSQGIYNCSWIERKEDLLVPKVETIEMYGISNMGHLASLELPSIQTLEGLALANTSTLVDLYLPGDTVCTLTATSAFTSSGISSNANAKIHVPADLVDTYKAATNWSTFASKIIAIEE